MEHKTKFSTDKMMGDNSGIIKQNIRSFDFKNRVRNAAVKVNKYLDEDHYCSRKILSFRNDLQHNKENKNSNISCDEINIFHRLENNQVFSNTSLKNNCSSKSKVSKRYDKSERKIENLEKFRRINLKILEEVQKLQQNPSRQSISADSDEWEDSELESLDEIAKQAAAEEEERTLNEDALQACMFLNQNYPNYFQHLIKRYQLDVWTPDTNEVKSRKLDMIKIAAGNDEKLKKLEKMYQREIKEISV
ncbi:hypothetical protein HHI36_011261 [Cryptolaemus montrouzieri]|uniref:Uncharacterized protein n=1 Tax=Cryptolaemus montrouzieri TaxID=559131 RepID=A0ABD2ML47_9CUCU